MSPATPTASSPQLISPLTFRSGAAVKNRLALAPLTNQQSHDDGRLGPDELRWLVRRAEGGFGLVETCAVHVSKDGQGFEGQLGIWGDHQLTGLGELAQAITRAGALGLVQLYHGGARAPSRLTHSQPVSASAFHEDRPGFEAPRAATEADLERIVSSFRAAAVRAQEVGFAGVEVHGAHGYLLSQFLSRTMNQRTDQWGGTLANRARLVRDVVRAIREAVRPSFLVGVRLSPEDFGFARGLDLDEGLEVASWLAEDGVDLLHLSLWDARRNTVKRPTEHPVPLFRSAVGPAVRLMAAGDVWTKEDAEELLTRGADLVALGKAAILNPDWPRLIAHATFVPVRGPLTPEELAQRDVGPRFAHYLRRFKDMVRDG